MRVGLGRERAIRQRDAMNRVDRVCGLKLLFDEESERSRRMYLCKGGLG